MGCPAATATVSHPHRPNVATARSLPRWRRWVSRYPAALPNGEPGAATPAADATPTLPSCTGPYLTWTRKVENKTVTRTLNPEQAERLRPLLHNARRLRELVSELEVLALEHVENAHEAHT